MRWKLVQAGGVHEQPGTGGLGPKISYAYRVNGENKYSKPHDFCDKSGTLHWGTRSSDFNVLTSSPVL